jgi:hypothetical protein
MKMIAPQVSAMALFAALVLAPAMALAQGQAPKADPAAQKLCDKLLGAIKANDRDAFVADATDGIKEGTTQAVMDALEKQIGMRLKKGYDSTYLCELKQAGHQVHVWKLTFKDAGDDVLVRVALKEGKVGGFFIQ